MRKEPIYGRVTCKEKKMLRGKGKVRPAGQVLKRRSYRYHESWKRLCVGGGGSGLNKGKRGASATKAKTFDQLFKA